MNLQSILTLAGFVFLASGLRLVLDSVTGYNRISKSEWEEWKQWRRHVDLDIAGLGSEADIITEAQIRLEAQVQPDPAKYVSGADYAADFQPQLNQEQLRTLEAYGS